MNAPPLTWSVWPVIQPDSSEARNTATRAISSGLGHPSLERDLSAELAELRLRVAVARLRGVGEPRSDGVHADAMRRERQRHAAREPHDPGLARRVVDAERRAPHGDRGEVDDGAPASPFDQAARDRLGAEEASLEVDVEHVVPVGLGHGQEFHAREDPRVVDEDPGRSQLARHGVDHRLRVPGPRDVALDHGRPAPCRAHLAGDPLGGAAVVQVVHADVGPVLRERHRDGASDALLGARDERDLTDETHADLRPARGPAPRARRVQYRKAARVAKPGWSRPARPGDPLLSAYQRAAMLRASKLRPANLDSPPTGVTLMRPRHREAHRTGRIGWLRAAVLGANDGIVSTASLVLGVAAADAGASSVLVAGTAGLVAGAMSMAAGEYVSVSSQADTERADLQAGGEGAGLGPGRGARGAGGDLRRPGPRPGSGSAGGRSADGSRCAGKPCSRRARYLGPAACAPHAGRSRVGRELRRGRRGAAGYRGRQPGRPRFSRRLAARRSGCWAAWAGSPPGSVALDRGPARSAWCSGARSRWR